ncbi:hypothetical protein HPB50_006783 [Hyalomma asiaticum]|uniref:Uncharacterized protein n=1 Tax=Hyalomma asiaticum TaxID=266040 RepID=A0ACB7SVZ2_HYAAI|nr:hypothetical protein HPB50_006783 [Hyalomma asiaticum]
MGSHLASVEDAGASVTVPRRESMTRKLDGALGHPTMQPEEPSSCTIPNLVQSVEGRGILSKEVQENKSEKCTVQGTVQNKVDRSSEHDLETPEHRERREEIVENKRTCPNRQVEMEPRVAPARADGSPSWSLLGCTLGLVGMVLMLLLTVIYSLTTSVSLPLTTQTSSLLSTKLDIIYCSSQFCDREADYIKSTLSSSGKHACENFYEHVCGAWPQAHPLYSTTGAGAAVSSDTIIQEKLDEQLASLLASSNADDLGVASAVYEACTDRKKADMAVNDVKELLKTWTIHEWPRDSNGNMKDTWKFAGELVRDLGVSSILDAVLAAGSQYSDNVVVELRKPPGIFLCSGPLRAPVISLVRAALHDIAVEFTQAPKAEILEEISNAFIRLRSSSLCPSVVELGGTKFTESVASVVKLSDLDSDVTHFLNVAFDGAIRLEHTTTVLLRQPRYLLDDLASVLRALSPRALMNYMGFMALVQLSAFLPERHAHLRQLFAKVMRDRTFPDVSNSSVLCAMAVERILPDCFNKLSSAIFKDAEYDARVPEKLSLLEDAFARHIEHLSWMSDELIILNRYRMKRRRASQLGPSTSANGSDSCAPSHVTWHKNSPVEFYRAVSRAQHYAACQLVIGGGARSSDASLRPSAVRAAYDPLFGRVQVPAALFNTSVPGNSAGFSLQLARYAVRFYRTLLEALFVGERGQIGPDDASRRRLETLLQCFEWDLRELPAALRGPVAPDPAMARGAILQQTAALQLAFRTFQELWQVRRAWNADFRYRRLPDVSTDALFFVYYALDNCENSDQVYKESQGQWLPAEYRVNLPLRHLVEFASLFNCSADTNMGLMGLGRTCAVVTPDTWSIRAPGDS